MSGIALSRFYCTIDNHVINPPTLRHRTSLRSTSTSRLITNEIQVILEERLFCIDCLLPILHADCQVKVNCSPSDGTFTSFT
jgi:hypothetical protein